MRRKSQVSKLTINKDFEIFLKRITNDIKTKEIIKELYDPILDREELIIPGLSTNPPLAINPLQASVTSELSDHLVTRQQQPQLHTKETDDTYTHTVVTSFTLKGVKYEVKRWRDALTSICEVMHEKHRDQFSRVLELKGQKHHWFSTNPSELTFPDRIDDSAYYVQNHWDANSIVSISKAIIAIFGYSKDDLLFDFKKKAEF